MDQVASEATHLFVANEGLYFKLLAHKSVDRMGVKPITETLQKFLALTVHADPLNKVIAERFELPTFWM